uniref:Secreted protein n=1 Tax=Craspedostauros australis TaxID=1486917 RepID=A0A7R9WXC5_9STRA|mmetsp:Transcript_2512/g.6998  ORF Transcript_2512/g.6998 Transcript_2512/m.6998 type:complete len:141 (+) Transcript_2512:325-747(+)
MSHTIALLRLVLWNNLTHCSVRMHSRDASRNVQQLLWVCKTTLNHPSATTDSEDQHAQTSADKRDQPASYGHVEANHDPDLPRTSEHAARALVTSVSYVETSMGAFGNAPTGWVLRSCVRVILHHALWMQHRSQSSAPAA